MTGQSPDRYWKATDYKISGKLKKLESEHAEMLETFDGHPADVESRWAQKKTVSAERAYQFFFETYDDLKKNRQQQRQLLKPKYLESFDAETERKLGERRHSNN